MAHTETTQQDSFHPIDLAEAPQVARCLERLGLGAFDPASVVSTVGRNANWIGTTDRGVKIFVKELVGNDRQVKLSRTVHVAAVGEGLVDMPPLAGVDEANSLVVTHYLPGARNGSELAADDEFDDDLCIATAELLAGFHQLPDLDFDRSGHPMPVMEPFRVLSLEYFLQATAAELAMWGMLQQDEPLRDALQRLRDTDNDQEIPRCPVHGDVRLDQFILSNGVIHLSDFEESRLGDPARDIGAFAGEWLFLAATALPETLADSLPLGFAATHQQIIDTGVGEVIQRSPRVRSFYRRYLECRPEARQDNGLAVRAASYAGWHLLDRMLAAAGQSARLSPVHRAAAGIGRTVLLAPAEFTGVLGLEA